LLNIGVAGTIGYKYRFFWKKRGGEAGKGGFLHVGAYFGSGAACYGNITSHGEFLFAGIF